MTTTWMKSVDAPPNAMGVEASEPGWAAGALDELTLVVDKMLDVVFRVDAAFRCTFVSPSAERSLGYRYEDVVGTDLRDLLHPDDLAGLTERMREAQAAIPDGLAPTRNAFGARIRHHVTGEYSVGEGTYGLVVDGEGRFAGGVIAWHDTRLRKGAKTTSRQILDALVDMVLVKGPRSKIIWANRAFREFYGMTEAQLLGIIDAPFNAPDNTQKYIRDDAHVFETGEVLETEEEVTRHDGRVFCVHTVKSPIRDGAGKIVMTVGLFRDISARKRAETGLVEAEARYREVTNAAREVIFKSDVTGRWQFLSPAWKIVTGYEVEESLGQHYLELLHPEDRDGARTTAHALLAEKLAFARHVVRFRTKAGRTRWMDLAASLSRDPAGKISGICGSCADVTSRHVSDALAEIGRTMDRCVVETADVDSLGQRVCDGLAASMRYPLVWLGLKGVDGSVRVAGNAGPVAGALGDLTIRWDETPEGSGPSGRAIRTGTTQLANVTDLKGIGGGAEALAGVGRVVAIPLAGPEGTLGVLLIGTGDALDPETADLRPLESFAGRVSLALQLVQQQALLALQGAAMTSSANAIFITDPRGRIEWVNDAFEQMSMYPKEEAVGRTPSFLRSGLQPTAWFSEMWAAVNAGGTWVGQLTNRRRDGTAYVVSQTVTPLFDKHGVLTHLAAAHEDITARREAEARVNHMAEHDALTDLPNRTLLRSRLRFALARGRDPLALLFVDLDRFKLVNDTLGHAAGDELLRTVSERIRACVRNHDVVARHGGDEFIVLLFDVATQAEAMIAAQRILKSLAQPLTIDGCDVHVTASIGVTLGPQNASDAESLMRQADAAMYRAKRSGRNDVVCYAPDLDGAASRGLTLQAGLARALSRGELSLEYQPQIDMPSGRIVGIESLLRWTSPELGVVTPADFIPLAEETGIIVDIDRWVLRTACAQRKAWELEGLDAPRLAVNLSGVSFRRHDLLDTVEQALKDADLAPHHLEIEVTEGVLMQDGPAVIKTLDTLRKIGVHVALDDFGTGYSSLSYLKRFKIDTLKIDRSFVTGLPDRADDAAIARLIAAMAKELGMSIIAEGVETEEQARFLESIGCTTAQGYLYSKAVSATAIADLLRRSVDRPLKTLRP